MPVIARATGLKLSGAVGEQGPSGTPYLAYPGGQVPSFGQLASINNVSINANIFDMDVAGGQDMPVLIRPLQTSALYQVVFYNASGSQNSATLTLRNYANDAVVFSTGAQTRGTTYTSAVFNQAAYPLAAGQTYYWGISGAATGRYTCWATPQFYGPSGGASSISSHPTFVLASSTALFGTTSLSTTAQYMGPVGFQTGNQLTFQVPYGGYVANVQFGNGGSGTANFFLQNVSANSLAWTGPSLSSGTTATTAALGPSVIPLTANTKYAWYVTGNGSMGQNVSMQLCQ